MPDTAREALEEIVFYIAPIYGRTVRLRAFSDDYWHGFDDAVSQGFIEERDCLVPYQREYRILRKGYVFAKEVGLIPPTPPENPG